MSASYSTTSFIPDNLVLDEGDILTRQITLLSGQNLQRGAILGKITASGKYTLSASAAGNGSEIPDAILVQNVDASGGDVVTLAYFSGRFNESKVTLGTGHTANSVREGLRVKNIHLLPATPIT